MFRRKMVVLWLAITSIHLLLSACRDASPPLATPTVADVSPTSESATSPPPTATAMPVATETATTLSELMNSYDGYEMTLTINVSGKDENGQNRDLYFEGDIINHQPSDFTQIDMDLTHLAGLSQAENESGFNVFQDGTFFFLGKYTYIQTSFTVNECIVIDEAGSEPIFDHPINDFLITDMLFGPLQWHDLTKAVVEQDGVTVHEYSFIREDLPHLPQGITAVSGRLTLSADELQIIGFEADITGTDDFDFTNQTNKISGNMTINLTMVQQSLVTTPTLSQICQDIMLQFPILDNARDLIAVPGRAFYVTDNTVETAVSFYQTELTEQGWTQVDTYTFSNGVTSVYENSELARTTTVVAVQDGANTKIEVATEDISSPIASHEELLTQGNGPVLVELELDHSHYTFSPDGQLLVAGTEEGEVAMWDSETGELLHLFSIPSQSRFDLKNIEVITFSPDGTILAATERQGYILVWDVEERTLSHQLGGQYNTISGLAFSPDGTQLAAASWEGLVIVWDVITGEVVRTLQIRPYDTQFAEVNDVTYSPNGSQIAAVSDEGQLYLWHSGADEPDLIIANAGTSVDFLDDNYFVTYQNSTLFLWDASQGNQLDTLRDVYLYDVSATGQLLIFNYDTSTLDFWSVQQGELVHHAEVMENLFLANLALSATGDKFAFTHAATGPLTVYIYSWP